MLFSAESELFLIYLHVVVDGSSLLNSLHDGGEVVVGEDHVGGLRGDLSAGNAHGDSDLGLLESRGVVDSVSGHRNDLVHFSEELDELSLVGGLGSREHESGRSLSHESELLALILQSVELLSGERSFLLVAYKFARENGY